METLQVIKIALICNKNLKELFHMFPSPLIEDNTNFLTNFSPILTYVKKVTLISHNFTSQAIIKQANKFFRSHFVKQERVYDCNLF